MVARVIEFKIKQRKKNEFLNLVQHEIVPLLHQQTGFVEILSFFPERAREDCAFTISLWTMKADAEFYEKHFHRIMCRKLRSCLADPVVMKPYTLETTLFENLAEVLAA